MYSKVIKYNAVQLAISGLLGTASVDSQSSLLAMIDEAPKAVSVNHAIMRRALKTEFNERVKLCEWTVLFTETFKTFENRFSGKMSAPDALDATGFFSLCTAQAMQKLVKTAAGKLKMKDTQVQKIIQSAQYTLLGM